MDDNWVEMVRLAVTLKLPKKLPYLERALSLDSENGLCFHRAVALVLDLPPATLAVGTLPPASTQQRQDDPNFSSVAFIHAWVEVKDMVLAPTLIERAISEGSEWMFPKDFYYSANAPRNVHHLNRFQVKKLSREFYLDKHLKDFTDVKDGAKFGEVILNAMGIKFIISKSGGVIPAPKEPK